MRENRVVPSFNSETMITATIKWSINEYKWIWEQILSWSTTCIGIHHLKLRKATAGLWNKSRTHYREYFALGEVFIVAIHCWERALNWQRVQSYTYPWYQLKKVQRFISYWTASKSNFARISCSALPADPADIRDISSSVQARWWLLDDPSIILHSITTCITYDNKSDLTLEKRSGCWWYNILLLVILLLSVSVCTTGAPGHTGNQSRFSDWLLHVWPNPQMN